MKCPFCGYTDSQVKDSRPNEDYSVIRRRRFCPECGGRFTTFEYVQLRELTVIKKNGERQLFDRDKLYHSLLIPLRKRKITPERLEKITTGLVRQLESLGESEIKSSDIGKLVMETLFTLDKVAFIRYASVYQNFTSSDDFIQLIKQVKEK